MYVCMYVILFTGRTRWEDHQLFENAHKKISLKTKFVALFLFVIH